MSGVAIVVLNDLVDSTELLEDDRMDGVRRAHVAGGIGVTAGDEAALREFGAAYRPGEPTGSR